MADPAQSIVAMSSWMHDAAARIHPAIRNLRELQPGFPSTTPGNGSVGGGSGFSSSSIVERLAGTVDSDDAVRDLARIRELQRVLEPKVRELHDLTLRWGYRRAGEFDPGAPSPGPGKAEADHNRERWCSSCERVKVAEPVGEKGRNGRCRWCSDFVAQYDVLPPIEILDARHRGIRITEPMITSALRTGPAPAGPRPTKKAKKRKARR